MTKTLLKKPVGKYKQHFLNARVVDKWNEFNCTTVSANNHNYFKSNYIYFHVYFASQT